MIVTILSLSFFNLLLQLILEGKNAIITGGNSGIGEAIAELFSSEGASIAITGRNESRGEKVVSNIEQKGGKAFFVQTDVSQSNSVDKMFATCFEKFPQIDILVNNAGIQIMKTLENLSETDWDTVMDTNAKGTFLCLRKIIPHMIKIGGGSIINVSSVAGLRGFATGGAYSASKAAVIMLTKMLALEYSPNNIRSNCICPGSVVTPMIKDYTANKAASDNQSFDDTWQNIIDSVPIGRIGSPMEIAKLALFLVSPDASFVNGSIFVADGGATAGQISPP